jgi:hypothetical protein
MQLCRVPLPAGQPEHISALPGGVAPARAAPLRPWLFGLLALLLVAEWCWGGHRLDWSLGPAFGAIMATAVWLYDSPTAHIEN